MSNTSNTVVDLVFIVFNVAAEFERKSIVKPRDAKNKPIRSTFSKQKIYTEKCWKPAKNTIDHPMNFDVDRFLVDKTKSKKSQFMSMKSWNEGKIKETDIFFYECQKYNLVLGENTFELFHVMYRKWVLVIC